MKQNLLLLCLNTSINPVMNSGISNTHMFKMLKQIQLLSFALIAGEVSFPTAGVENCEPVESDEDCGGRL